MWSRWKLSESQGIKTRWRVPETGCDNEAGRGEEVERFDIYLERIGELRDSLRNDQRFIIKDKMIGLIGVGTELKVCKYDDFLGWDKINSPIFSSVQCIICAGGKNEININ